MKRSACSHRAPQPRSVAACSPTSSYRAPKPSSPRTRADPRRAAPPWSRRLSRARPDARMKRNLMDPSGTAEFELLTQWCEGSDRAGDLLLRRCFPVLYRFFINKVGDATDDLVQQTLIACIRHRDKMLDSGAFRMYPLKIARSRLYATLRASRRR